MLKRLAWGVIGLLLLPTIEAVPAGAQPTITIENVVPYLESAYVDFDVTASEGELRACYYVDTPDDPAVSEATTLTWTDTDGGSHIAVTWDWHGSGTARTGTIRMLLEPDDGVTPAAITSIHAECTVRYVAGTREVRRTRTSTKNGTQTSSRGWSALSAGGSCNYGSLRGDLLTTCLFARSVSIYGMRSQNRIIGSFVHKHAGIFACHTSVDKDVSHRGHAIRFTLVTSNASGYAQCWVENVGIRVVYFKTVKDYDVVDVAADWGQPAPVERSSRGEPERRPLS